MKAKILFAVKRYRLEAAELMDETVTLVNPPYPEKAYQHPPFIPLGLAYLGAVLEKNGYSVNVIDCQAQKLTHSDFRREIDKKQPMIIFVQTIDKNRGQMVKTEFLNFTNLQ